MKSSNMELGEGKMYVDFIPMKSSNMEFGEGKMYVDFIPIFVEENGIATEAACSKNAIALR